MAKQKLLLYLLLFFLPTQLGRHFWFDFSYKLGMKVDYLSPTIYLTDIIIFLIIIIFIYQNHNLKLKISLFNCFIVSLLITVIGYWLIVIRENPYLLVYNLIRLGEFILLGIVIAKTFTKKDFPKIISVLNAALVIQVGLALYQVLAERSLGLWILGERSFTIATPGIAKFTNFSGSLFLRGYGTFPHPNVLAGFCLILLVANAFLFLGKFNVIPAPCLPAGRKAGIYKNKQSVNYSNRFRVKPGMTMFFLFGFITSLLGVWLSLSILAILISQLFIIYLILKYFKKRADTRVRPYKLLLITPIVILLFGGYRFLGQFQTESITTRMALLNFSWDMFKSSPLFGVGLGNFIPKMPEVAVGRTYFWQPVHNIPVLILVETGLAGLSIVLLLIWKGFNNIKYQISNIKNKNNNLSIILLFWWIIILFTGMADHYLLTLQQGRLLLVVIIAMSFILAR